MYKQENLHFIFQLFVGLFVYSFFFLASSQFQQVKQTLECSLTCKLHGAASIRLVAVYVWYIALLTWTFFIYGSN